MKSNPSDPGRPEGLRDDCELPTALVAALERARPRLGRLASTVRYFETIGSTNDEAARQSSVGSRQSVIGSRQSAGTTSEPSALSPQPVSSPQPQAPSPEGLVVVADAQTSGRGRRGHTWFSPPGSGLYVSVVLAPSTAIDSARATVLLTLAAGVALAEGIEQAAGLRVDLKWPNDLLVSGRKVGGILAESSGSGDRFDTVVVGYGINVQPASFPPELRSRATSLETELGRAVDRHQLLVETLAALSRRYDDLLAGRFDAILDAWRRLAPGGCGARVTWTTNQGTASGTTAGIDDRGALLVRIGDRIERIVSGEVVWL